MSGTNQNIISVCPKCNKPYIYIGDVPEGGFAQGTEPWCTCRDLFVQSKTQLTGWICPICGRGCSPYSTFCPCNVKYEITC